MKRLLVLLAFVAGLLAVFAVLRSEVSTDAVAARIAGVLIPFGDRKPDFQAHAEVRLFPRLAVVFREVRIAATRDATLAEPDLTANSITAPIDILPLFIGQTSVSRLILFDPVLRVRTTFDLAGFTPRRAVLDRMLPASVVIHHGEIRIKAPNRPYEEAIRSIEADLRWPRVLGNLSLEGTADWHDELVSLSLQGIAPPRLASGESGDLDMNLNAPSFRLRFAGKALMSDLLQLDGLFSAGADDPRQLAATLISGTLPTGRTTIASAQDAPSAGLPPIEVDGRLRSQGWMGSLSDARLKIGTIVADGVLSARFDQERPQLRGTLAIGDIDLRPALSALKTQHWLEWSPDPMAIAGLDVDLRLSIGDALIGAARLTNVAASLLIAEGEVHAEVGDATLLGGNGSVILHGNVDHDGLKAAGRFTLVGAPLDGLRSLLSLDTLPSVSGVFSLIGDFDTGGNTLQAAISGLHGKATLEAPKIVFDGFAGPAVAFAAAPSPILQATSLQVGLRPQVDQLVCTASFAAQDLSIERFDFRLADLKFGLTGRGSLASRAVGLAGEASRAPALPSGTSDPVRPAGIVPVHVSGTLDHPNVIFDREIPAPGDTPKQPASAN